MCDIHVVGRGEHLPAWGLRDDRIPGTDQGRSREDAMGRSCILDSHSGRWMPAAMRMPTVVQMLACDSSRFKGEGPLGAPQANGANHQGLVPSPPHLYRNPPQEYPKNPHFFPQKRPNLPPPPPPRPKLLPKKSPILTKKPNFLQKTPFLTNPPPIFYQKSPPFYQKSSCTTQPFGRPYHTLQPYIN